MAKMSVEMLARCTGQTKRKRGESTESLLQRVTHLYCSERGISSIEGLAGCHSLSVLYLYSNPITQIQGLGSCSNLTHLYLQNSHISCLEGLTTLHRLSKLYVNDNAISVVEGLEECGMLTELHIANQRLHEGEKLLFDPRSIQAIASSLALLNVSGNNLDSLRDLTSLKKLVTIIASENSLSSMKDLASTLGHWGGIERVEFSGNPLCSKHKYRDRVITMTPRISMLDGREVSETERLFLASWKATRKARRKALQQHKVQPGLQPSAAHYVLSSDPPPPPTMPALPARSPLKQWRKIHHQMKAAGQPISLPTLVHQQHLKQAPVVAHYTLQDNRHSITNNTGYHGSIPVLPNILQSIT